MAAMVLARPTFAVEYTQPQVIEHHLAVDGVCAWPKLTTLPDGTIAAALFDQPNHQKTPGSIQCYVSRDQGQTWQHAGTPGPKTDTTFRVNHAIGVDADGELVVISGGKTIADRRLIKPIVARTSDQGATWDISEQFPASPDGREYVPFGNLTGRDDGGYLVPAYTPYYGPCYSYILRGDANAENWETLSRLPKEDYGENVLLNLGDGEWLSAVRYNKQSHWIEVLRSTDDARSWDVLGQVTASGEHPAHLLELPDGRVVMTYGDRTAGNHGVEALISTDRGRTWGEPIRLADAIGDCGYPSSVLLSDGNILTAFYAQSTADHDNYHMRVVTWNPGVAVPEPGTTTLLFGALAFPAFRNPRMWSGNGR
jgi:hypothetical protein